MLGAHKQRLEEVLPSTTSVSLDGEVQTLPLLSQSNPEEGTETLQESSAGLSLPSLINDGNDGMFLLSSLA